MSDHPIPLQELEYFPCYPDRIFSSMRWKQMEDFQRGWYWELLLKMTRSKPVGYLPFDGQLWTLAGARTKQYFDENAAVVLACFKVCEFDGRKWIYSQPLIDVLCRSNYKHAQAVQNGRVGGFLKQKRSRAFNKYSFEFQTIWEKNTWKCVAKPAAYRAFEKALENIQQEKKIARDSAIAFLADAMEEFKLSPAGKSGGMFEGYTPPYPASWLNAGRYFDDRGTWRPGRSGTANVAGSKANGSGRAPERKSLAEKDCATCGGSGWASDNGKAKRCECWERNRNAIAASGTS